MKNLSFLKIFKKGNEISGLIYIFNARNDRKGQKKIMIKLLYSHKISCEDTNCHFCRAIISKDLKTDKAEGEENKMFGKFVKCYFKYLVKKDFLESKGKDIFFTTFYYLIEMNLINYSKTQNFVKNTIKYKKFQKIFSNFKLKSDCSKRLSGKNFQFLKNFETNYSLLYHEMLKDFKFSEAETKRLYMIKVDYILSQISKFIDNFSRFISLGLKTPDEIFDLSNSFSELRKTIDIDFLLSKDNRYNYQCVLCQFIFEALGNSQISKTTNISDIIHSFDEMLSMHFADDKLILSLFDFSLCTLEIRQCGEEFIPFKGKAVKSLFPYFIAQEGVRRCLESFTSNGKKEMNFYINDSKTKNYERIKFIFYLLPNSSISNYDFMYVLGNYSIKNEKLMFFDKHRDKIVNDFVLIGLSNNACTNLGIDTELVEQSIKSKNYIRYSSFVDNEFFIHYQKLFHILKKIFPQKDFNSSKKREKFMLKEKEIINDRFIIYSLKEQNKKTKSLLATEYTKKNEDSSESIEQINNFLGTVNTGGSSSCNQSSLSSYRAQVNDIKNQQDSQYRMFNIYAYYILALNIVIIIMIAVFLVIELLNNNWLKSFFETLTNFNNFQGNFYHASLSIFSLACNSDFVEQLNCVNQFKVISEKFAKENGFTNKELLSEYVARELFPKSKLILSTLNSWNQQRDKVSTGEIAEINAGKFQYNIISEVNGIIKAELKEFLFSDAAKKYVNIINFLATSEDYLVSPVYIITIDGKELYDLTNISDKKETQNGIYLNESQRYFYTMLMNFQKYIKRLSQVGDLLTIKYYDEISKTTRTLVTFIAVFIILHLFLLVIVFTFGFKFIGLHKRYYQMIYEKLSDENFIIYFKKKLSYISDLTYLYKVEPSKVIQHIEHSKRKEIQRRAKKDMKQKEPVKYNQEEVDKYYIKYLNKKSTFKILLVLGGYILICLIISIIIFIELQKLRLMNKYAKSNFDLTNYIYINLGLTQLMSLSNQTDYYYYNYFLNEEEDDTDKSKRYVNKKIEEVLQIIKDIQQMEEKYSEFKSSSTLLEFKCEKLYSSLNDPVVNEVIENYPDSRYLDMLIAYCKTFTSLDVYQDEKLSIESITYQTSSLLNKFKGRTFEILAGINNSDLLYTLYCELLLILRPIRRFIYFYLTDDVITKIISDYNCLIIIFIIISFIYDLFILLFTKVWIINFIAEKSKEIIKLGCSFECI